MRGVLHAQSGLRAFARSIDRRQSTGRRVIEQAAALNWRRGAVRSWRVAMLPDFRELAVLAITDLGRSSTLRVDARRLDQSWPAACALVCESHDALRRTCAPKLDQSTKFVVPPMNGRRILGPHRRELEVLVVLVRNVAHRARAATRPTDLGDVRDPAGAPENISRGPSECVDHIRMFFCILQQEPSRSHYA